jgi:hypothetical protein
MSQDEVVARPGPDVVTTLRHEPDYFDRRLPRWAPKTFAVTSFLIEPIDGPGLHRRLDRPATPGGNLAG